MHTHFALLSLPYLSAAVLWSGDASIATATTAPSGGYQVLTVRLAGAITCNREGWDARPEAEVRDLDLTIGMRDGRVASVWFRSGAESGWAGRYWLIQKDLTLTNGALKGRIGGHDGADSGECFHYEIEFDAQVAGSSIAGTYKHNLARTQPIVRAGALSGTVASPAPLAAGPQWPSYYGPFGTYQAAPGTAALITDLSQAVPLWKSEAWILAGFGNSPDARYSHVAGYRGLGGGSSSPVVAGGRVFQMHYRPNATGAFDQKNPYSPWKNDPVVKEKMMMEKFPNLELARTWWADFFRISADDVVTCIDAATGRTLWEAVLPMRTMNYQTHKHRGYFSAPMVAGDVLYAGPNLMGRVYAFEAATGKLLWESGLPVTGGEQTCGGNVDTVMTAPTAVLAGGNLIVGGRSGTLKGLAALDASTGKLVWEKDDFSMAPFMLAKVGGRTMLLRPSGSGIGAKAQFVLKAYDPADGKELWTAEKFPSYQYNILPLLVGDDRLLALSVDNDPKAVIPGKSDGTGTLHCLRVQADGMQPLWSATCPVPMVAEYAVSANATQAFVVGGEAVYSYDLATGAKTGQVEGLGGARTQTCMVAQDRLIIAPEGRHGVQYFSMTTTDPKDFRELAPKVGTKSYGLTWQPPHPHTTGYAVQAINYPVVDGRLFVRGRDGIYCYDLRAAAK